ncbi:hypothetical protein PVAND_007511 [Polypedilum vanderplanki]|uniref:Secreted protein n=1 Tax=Polypedilum vanderplanki TaxID=319348 RepID=A0A9J6C6I3_POLVA|nr:hypothetical protein PVAND_007511 [Polypedilum vanderplanki]
MLIIFLIILQFFYNGIALPLRKSSELFTTKIETTTRESQNDIAKSTISFFEIIADNEEINENTKNLANIQLSKKIEKSVKNNISSTISSTTAVNPILVDNRLGENQENEHDEIVPLKITCILVLCGGG